MRLLNTNFPPTLCPETRYIHTASYMESMGACSEHRVFEFFLLTRRFIKGTTSYGDGQTCTYIKVVFRILHLCTAGCTVQSVNEADEPLHAIIHCRNCPTIDYTSTQKSEMRRRGWEKEKKKPPQGYLPGPLSLNIRSMIGLGPRSRTNDGPLIIINICNFSFFRCSL